MKTIITGCAGFVGSNILERLNKSYGVDNLSFGKRENVPLGASYANVGFADLPESFLSKFDTLIHCAVTNIIYSQQDSEATLKNNALDAISFFQKFSGKIIYLSSTSVYGQAITIPTPETSQPKPRDVYACSKLVAELFLRARGNYTTLRLSNVYGERQRPDNPYCGVVARFVDNIINQEAITLNANHTRDYTYIGDIVDGVEKAVRLSALNTEINLGTGLETSTMELAEEIWSIVGYRSRVEILGRRPIDTIERRCLDIGKAKNLLQWAPKMTLEEGLRRTIEWQRSSYFRQSESACQAVFRPRASARQQSEAGGR